MSYKSPIEIITTMHNQIEHDVENNVFKLIRAYGINVDKDELIKALKYDRDQYNAGYIDGSRGKNQILKEFAMYATEKYFDRKFFKESYTVDEILILLNNDIENFIEGEQP